jgi:uncharacterized protein involved in outer membrane biogenesis
MKKAGIWIAGIIGVLVVAIVLVVVFFQWSWLKGPLEARLSAMTGKKVTIDGPITGTKSWVPTIHFSQVRIEAPEFTAAPKVATIGDVAVSIDLKQLLHGKIDFPEIDIEKPDLDLLRQADGKANWDIAADSKGPSSRSSMPIIGLLKIDDGKIVYDDVGKHTKIDAAIKTVAAKGGSGEGAFTVEGHGVYRQAPFTISLKGGSLNDLRDTKDPYKVEASASVGTTRLTIAGTVTNPFKLTDLDLQATAQGENAEDLYPIFGIPAPSTPPYHLSGFVDRDGDTWRFKNFTGTVGKSDLEGTLKFVERDKRLFLGGDLTSKKLDFADLGLLVGAPGSTAAGRPVSETQKELAHKQETSGRVLPDAPLNLNEVRNVDADITFKGEHIQAQTLPLDDVTLHLVLDHGLLSLKPLDVGVAGGKIDSDIVIDARGPVVETDYDVRLEKFQIQQFFQRAGFPQGGSGFIYGRIRLHGAGDSVRKSLGTSNGEATATIANGTISNLAADILGLDVAKALGLLITGDKQIALRCMVVDFQVDNGLMKPRTLLLDTDSTIVNGKGSINLADEHLDLSISGENKSASPLSLGGPILIGGTFLHPTAGLGAKAIAKGAGAVALGVLLTPIAAALAFIDPGDAKDADCSKLEQQATDATAVVPAGTKHIPRPSSSRHRSERRHHREHAPS